MKLKKQVEFLFKPLLFEEGGIYTLFGSKPITSILLFKGAKEDLLTDLSSISDQTDLFFEDCPTYEDWRAWKQYSNKLNIQKFIFSEQPCETDPSQEYVLLVNESELRKVLAEEKDAFLESWGEDFSIDWAVEELHTRGSKFWTHILTSPFLAGIVYGYGRENARQFSNARGQKKVRTTSIELSPSSDSLRIPLFRVFKDKDVVQKYSEEREVIRDECQNQDIFKILKKGLTQKALS